MFHNITVVCSEFPIAEFWEGIRTYLNRNFFAFKFEQPIQGYTQKYVRPSEIVSFSDFKNKFILNDVISIYIKGFQNIVRK